VHFPQDLLKKTPKAKLELGGFKKFLGGGLSPEEMMGVKERRKRRTWTKKEGMVWGGG